MLPHQHERRAASARTAAAAPDRPTPGIRGATSADWPTVKEIYREGIDTEYIIVEQNTLSWVAFDLGSVPRLDLSA